MIDLPHPIHVPGHPTRKLGLILPMVAPKAKISFAHMKEALGISVPAHPVPFDFLSAFPADSGALLNDTLGCCAFAGIYHGIQVAVFDIRKKLVSATSLTPLVLDFYEKCGGYDPNAQLNADGTNPTDGGGNPIDIEKWLLDNPLPLPRDPALDSDEEDDDFFFTFDIDPSNLADMAYVGSECYGVGIGVIVTDAIMLPDGSIANPFPAGGNPLGGHFMWCAQRKADGLWGGISWGKKYEYSVKFMTPFNGQDMSDGNLMMVTGYIHSVMFEGGKTVMGMNKDQLRAYLDEYASEVTEQTQDQTA
jgi:hypothetical protein